MGAGQHGLNGVNPAVSISMWQTYVRPRLMYGLESVYLSKSDTSKLELYQRKVLRQILHLPERVASCAIYILSGQLPLEADLHKRRLSLYGNIVRNDCIERELATRQLAIKDNTSKSWFVALQEVLYRYRLPTAYDLLQDPPDKLTWKIEVRRHVNDYWVKRIIDEAETKSTLEFLNVKAFAPGKVHPIWINSNYNSNSILKANVQVKMACGTYILQSTRARFNQYQVSRVCPLCRASDETLQHFLLRCISLQSTRQLFIDELKALVGGINEEELQALILDPSMVDILGVMTTGDMMGCLYSLSRSLCYALHVRRSILLACV